MQLYDREVSFLTPADGGPKINAPIEQNQDGTVNSRQWNLKFDLKQDELVYQNMNEYQTFEPPASHAPVEQIYSIVHLKRGIFLSSGSDLKLKVWVPGRSMEPNYLGQLEEDYPATNLEVFGQHLKKKDEELQVVYACG